ncbi:putative reverse transcriptase domain-containing protein [Tanacetum coccineum]|uniref:Reverse transcriptase domain-containing protein n=1 Tax=Tanacetum coccineum TaxID=301880 RepID=A0ABQ5FFS1_9ASTR
MEDEVEDEVESSERGTMEVVVDVVAGIDILDGMFMPDAVERLEQRIEDIETRQRELESRSLIADGERASLLEQVASLERSNIRRFRYYDRMRFRRLETFTVRHLVAISRIESHRVLCLVMLNNDYHSFWYDPEAIEELDNRRVVEALAAYEATRAANAIEAESQSQNGSNGDNGNGGNGNGGDGNGGNGNGGNGNLNENNRDARPVSRECTYQDFMKSQPLDFKGMEGVVGLIRWFEKMETIFYIINCPEKYKLKYATCTLLNIALTWWNSHKRTVGTDAAFSMSWRELMKLMAEVYCLRNEIQKIESELWNLTVKNNDLAAYTQRFQELTMMCTKMVPEEEGRVEKFIGGLPDNIQGIVISAEPTKLKDAVRIANNLMDQKLKGSVVKNVENKRRLEVNQRDNHGQHPLFKRPNVRGTDRIFVSTTFSTLLDITPDTLDVSYAVELADGRIFETNTILRGCTLGLLGHPFNIDLMPVELSSFDVIIGMDCLANHHAVIVYDEKIMQIPYGDEVLLVQVTKKETEDKAEEKRLKDVPTIRDFPEVFPEDFPGLPPTRQVEFQIDLVPSAAPVAPPQID